MILSRGFGILQTGPWWNLRTHLTHQQLPDDPVPVPEHIWQSLAPLERLHEPDLVGRLKLEQGLLRHLFSQDRQAADLFADAAKATKIQFQLTGALGKRTKFQNQGLTQLVLLAKSRNDGSEDEAKINVPETMQLNDDTLLEQTEYTSSTDHSFAGVDPANQPALRPLDQCILLGMCLNVRNTSPLYGLTSEQMMPYISQVMSHPRNWSVHTMALLIPSGACRSDAHGRQHALRVPPYVHSIPLPSKWAMEKELADRFLSIGVVKSALEIFERLEMWEGVVKCYQSIERRDRALEIVHDLSARREAQADVVIARGKTAEASPGRIRMDTAREAKLWCLLGELDPPSSLEHYNRAWQVSNSTSARAARALGGYHFARGDYTQAIPHLKSATALQPLLTRPWFLMGCAYVWEEAWVEARDAFTRCVGIDQEDGESWNNIASV
ncbi:putative TPR repeat protein, partial [Rhizoctonia solani 123E]